MKRIKSLLSIVVVSIALQANAQLLNGSTAPDFTLMDIVDSNTYNLYDYLESGKTVFVEIFAAHCGGCWGYHQANTMKNLYNNYGPNGTDEVMVFALEYDQWNHYNHFIGIGDAWNTAGNWLEGTPYPIFNVEDPDRTVFSDYNVSFYPVVYKICPDKTTELVSTGLSYTQLYDKAQACEPLDIDEEVLSGLIYVNPSQKELVVENFNEVRSIQVLNLQGQQVFAMKAMETNTVDLSALNSGVYLFQFTTDRGATVRRFMVE